MQAKLHAPSKGLSTTMDNFLPGSLIHMDFKFYNQTSIRGFTSILPIIDAKKRNLWTFPGSDKHPPIIKVELFINFLKKQNRDIKSIHVDEGGELARSSEFIKLPL